MVKTMLTTVDNPFSPFDEWEQWYAWDVRKGYNSSSLLAYVAKLSLDLSDKDIDRILDEAIDEIVRENVSGVHTKAVKVYDIDMRVP